MTENSKPPRETVSRRFDEALQYAVDKHRCQLRKDGRVPYIAHLMGVSALVLEHGGDEDQAIAGLLHDAPEDQGGAATLEEIRRRFGDGVADIVRGCTEKLELGKREWRTRKTLHLEHMRGLPDRTLLVLLADKVHNGRGVLDELDRVGLEVFDRFGGKLDGTLWYYREMCAMFSQRIGAPLSRELERIVTRMEHAASTAE